MQEGFGFLRKKIQSLEIYITRIFHVVTNFYVLIDDLQKVLMYLNRTEENLVEIPIHITCAVEV